MNFKKVWKDLTWLTIFVVAIQVLLSKVVYPLIPGVGVTQNLFSITPQTALTSPTIGNSVIGILTGIIPFNLGDLMVWLSIAIGTFLLLLAGYFVYEQKFAWKGKNIYQRLMAILLYGTAVLWVVLAVLNMANFSTLAVPLLIGVAVNYVLVTILIVLLAKTKFLGKLIRI